MQLTVNEEADTQVRALALEAIASLDSWLTTQLNSATDVAWRAHYVFAAFRIERMRADPASIEQIVPVTTPPGEPIGETLEWGLPL